MVKLIPPMFTRLYISIIVALCASIFLTFQFMQSYLEKDAIDDFVRDTGYVYQDVRQLWQQENRSAEAFFASDKAPESYLQFELNLLNAVNTNSPCKDCFYLSSIGNIDVYENTDGRMSSVYPLPGSEHLLIISDRQTSNTEEINETEWYQDEEELLPIVIFAVALLVIGGVLYYPTRKLHKQIETLIQTQSRFGKGELNTRADENIPAPLSDLAVNFNQMAEEIDSKVSENLVFAQAVPHEMRTPLSRIQLASGLLRKTCEQQSQLELLDNIDNYIDDLDDLTAQVVAYSRLNSTHTADDSSQNQSVGLKAFIASRLTALQPDSDVEIHLDADDSLSIECDTVHLRLLVDNLLKNALLYTHSKIAISVTQTDTEQTLIIEDDGPGIPEDKRQYIFVPFARLDKSRDRKTGGLGLGLAIASAAAKKLNGTLTVTNSESGGARFVMSRKVR